MAPKAFKALCLLVHFLINESHGRSQPITVYRICCAATTIFANNSRGKIKEGPKQNMFTQNSHYKACTIDQEKVSQKWNETEPKKKGPTGSDEDRHCRYVEITNEICNERQTTTTSNGTKVNNGKDCESHTVFSFGVIVGAVLGGAVFGSFITMIVFLCFCRRNLFPQNRYLDCKPAADENLQESSRSVVTETVYNEINDQTVIRIQPMRRPESAYVSPKEETYNHLHESDKEDRNKSYDHARPVSSSCVREDGYGVLTRVGNNNREDQTIATADDVPNQMQSDNYFIIEPQ